MRYRKSGKRKVIMSKIDNSKAGKFGDTEDLEETQNDIIDLTIAKKTDKLDHPKEYLLSDQERGEEEEKKIPEEKKGEEFVGEQKSVNSLLEESLAKSKDDVDPFLVNYIYIYIY